MTEVIEIMERLEALRNEWARYRDGPGDCEAARVYTHCITDTADLVRPLSERLPKRCCWVLEDD